MIIIDIITEYISLLPIICFIYVILFVIIMSLSVWWNVQLIRSNLEEEHNSCYQMLLKFWQVYSLIPNIALEPMDRGYREEDFCK